MMTLVENNKVVEAIAHNTNSGALAGDYISMKHVAHVTVLVHIVQGSATPVNLTVNQATAVAGTGAKALAKEAPIWANLDCEASDIMVRQTDAVDFSTGAALKHKIIAFEIDAALLDVDNNFDCIQVSAGASSVDNIVSAVYVCHGVRHGVGTPVITD